MVWYRNGDKMKKALLVSTVSGFVPQFEMNNVHLLQNLGYEVHYAANYTTPSFGIDNSRLDGTGIIQHHFCIQRSPLSMQNLVAYYQLVKLMKALHFDLVHCHTPMGGILARLAAARTKTRPVLYTAHGFHFYRGASLKNWLMYFPAEWLCSKFTDYLITINTEDYQFAQKKMASRNVYYIPGVGVNTMQSKIDLRIKDKSAKRNELGIDKFKTVILCVGELIKRKNYQTALYAFSELHSDDACLLICGHGKCKNEIEKLACDLKIENQVVFCGFRNDIDEILSCSDIFLFPSFQEGLSKALMEAMAVGLPVVCSRIRGNIDLIEHEYGGYLFDPLDVENFTNALRILSLDSCLREKMGEYNKNKIKHFDISYVSEKMEKLYRSIDDITEPVHGI